MPNSTPQELPQHDIPESPEGLKEASKQNEEVRTIDDASRKALKEMKKINENFRELEEKIYVSRQRAEAAIDQ